MINRVTIVNERLNEFEIYIDYLDSRSIIKAKNNILLAKQLNTALIKMNPFPLVLSAIAAIVSVINIIIDSNSIGKTEIILCGLMIIIIAIAGILGVMFYYFPIKEANDYMYDRAIEIEEEKQAKKIN